MNKVMKELQSSLMKDKEIPELHAGDNVKVHVKIKEGDRERTQIYEGVIIAIKNKNSNKTITVRKISFGVGVERIFPLYSPKISKITVVKKGKVRRSKLYYLRNIVGQKGTRIKEK